jgi:hypothetical protein
VTLNLNLTHQPLQVQHRISNKTREILQHAAARRLKELEKLHWDILGFMTAKTSAGRKSQNLILAEIAAEIREIEAASSELNRVYEAQFTAESPTSTSLVRPVRSRAKPRVA